MVQNKLVETYVEWLSEIIQEPVDPADNFLDSGGNSMIAITLNKRLKASHGVDVSLGDLFTLSIEQAIAKSMTDCDR